MRKKPLRRPVKKPRLKRRRVLEQKRRLSDAGYTEEQLPADNDCFFVTGNTSVGTFVEGPFPCVLKLNE